VRTPQDLAGLDGLVVPGGESTTLLELLEPRQLGRAIGRWATEQGGRVFGTCAGAILVSREVLRPAQPSLGLLDAVIERNAYGRQVDSFITTLQPEPASTLGSAPLEAVFIRAPRFTSVGPGVEVLASREGEPVLVRSGRVLAATFHPELTGDVRVHALFLRMLSEAP
jgi:5'-phosphate synthase pdxT subunit